LLDAGVDPDAMRGDGVLIRRGSGATVERNWIFYNGGVGV